MEIHHCINNQFLIFNNQLLIFNVYLFFSRHLACEEGRVQEAGLLIKSGADSTLLNKEKLTPFDLAPSDVQGILRKI